MTSTLLLVGGASSDAIYKLSVSDAGYERTQGRGSGSPFGGHKLLPVVLTLFQNLTLTKGVLGKLEVKPDAFPRYTTRDWRRKSRGVSALLPQLLVSYSYDS